MIETRFCPACDMEFDWPGVEEGGETYCCEACAEGRPCICPQHGHDRTQGDVPLPGNVRGPGGM